VITDVVFAYSTAQNAFCCLVGAILKSLCPRKRRVFQSKLGVSSSNQCNLHHSPHTGHLEKKIKQRVQSCSDTVYKRRLQNILHFCISYGFVFREGIRFQLLHRTVLYICCRPNEVVGTHTLKIEATGSAETSVTPHPQDITLPRHRNQNHKHGLIKKLHCINYTTKHLEILPMVCKIF
jgi:hypothetical protein